MFSQFGSVISTKIILDRAGISRGYGFITFEKEVNAQKAISESNNLILNSRKLNVSPAVIKQGNQYSIDNRTFPPEIYNYPHPYPGQISQVSNPTITGHGNSSVGNAAATATTQPTATATHLYTIPGPYPGTFCSSDGYLYQLPTSIAPPAVGAHPLNGHSPYLASVGLTHEPGTIPGLTTQQPSFIQNTAHSTSQPYPGTYPAQYPQPHPSYVYPNSGNSSLITNGQTGNVITSSGSTTIPISGTSGATTHLYPVQQQLHTAQYSISQAPVIGSNTSGSAPQYANLPNNSAITNRYLNTHLVCFLFPYHECF